MPVEKGLALLTGMDIVALPLPSGDLEKDYSLRAKMVIEALNKFDGLYIHIKGPDEPAHDGDFQKKVESIEAIDSFFFGNLLQNIDLKDVVIAVTSDHSTPCKLKAHSDDPVPILIVGGEINGEEKGPFCERTSKSGSIGELNGPQIMPLLLKYL